MLDTDNDVWSSAQEQRLQAAGRTDSGVHAQGQCVSFLLPSSLRMSPLQLRAGINACLPSAVRVLDVARAPPAFSARHRCTKLYKFTCAQMLARFAFWPGASYFLLLGGKKPAQLCCDAVRSARNITSGSARQQWPTPFSAATSSTCRRRWTWTLCGAPAPSYALDTHYTNSVQPV